MNLSKLVRHVGADMSDVSVNLDNQKVQVQRENDRHRHKTIKRTVYRIKWDRGQLVGSVLRLGRWMHVYYEPASQKWIEY